MAQPITHMTSRRKTFEDKWLPNANAFEIHPNSWFHRSTCALSLGWAVLLHLAVSKENSKGI